MLLLQTAAVAVLVTLVRAQLPATTPVPILKQINRQNDDGSYSFGYEAADGSFKIETKLANGDVAGKYGYVDETGNLREISYGASSKRGFEPQGEGIVVPPPALNEPTTNELRPGDEDDGQYREDPRVYEDAKYNRNSAAGLVAPAGRLAFRQFHKAVQPQQPEYDSSPAPAPAYAPSSFRSSRPLTQVYHQQPTFNYNAYTPQQNQYQPQYRQPQFQQQEYQQPQYQQPQYQQPQYQQPQYQQPQYQNQSPQYNQYQPYQQQSNYNPFFGHPAQNFDPNTGSYSITYSG